MPCCYRSWAAPRCHALVHWRQNRWRQNPALIRIAASYSCSLHTTTGTAHPVISSKTHNIHVLLITVIKVVMSDKNRIVFFTTSFPVTVKAKSDITRIRQLLNAKHVEYEEVRCGRFDIFQLSIKVHLRIKCYLFASCRVQVDLIEQPGRKQEMIEASDGNTTIPQLHVNGTYIGR